MTVLRSSTCALALLLGACNPSPSSSPPEEPAAEPVAETRAEAVEAEPSAEAVEPESPAEAVEAEPPAEAGEVWRFTTLVTGGPEALVGANGYYELVLDGEQVTVRKVGQKGTTRFEEAKILEGTGTLSLSNDPHWSGARMGTVTVTLANASTSRPMAFDLWFWNDELHGTWVEPHARGDQPTIGRAWGLLEGVPGRGEPRELHDGDHAPCTYCNRAFYNCEGTGEGGCNSSDEGITACNRRMRNAAKKAGPLPRGCGDWM